MAGGDGSRSVVRSEPVASRTRRLRDVPESIDGGVAANVLRSFSGPRSAWLAPEGPSVIGCETTATIECGGSDRFAEIRERGTALLEAVQVDAPPDAPAAVRPRLVGGFAFHAGFDATPPWRGFAGARFVLPRIQIVETNGDVWATVTGRGPDADRTTLDAALDAVADRLEAPGLSSDPPPGIVSTERIPEREGWHSQVEGALADIAAGELDKVVLAQRLRARLAGPFRLADALARLGEAYPDCYRFAVDPGMGATFFGATPERLVSVAGNAVETEALAGSIARGGTPSEDERLATTLAESPKAAREHRMVVEAVRDRLAAMPADVTVGERDVRRLANVQHLRTPVTARLEAAEHVLSVVEALHPTPAVGGLPQEAAKRTIASTETFDRGWYAAPVGWFDAAGDGTFSVAIRSALASNASATLFAGNGIVADSDPDEEWDELQLKYRPILDQLR